MLVFSFLMLVTFSVIAQTDCVSCETSKPTETYTDLKAVLKSLVENQTLDPTYCQQYKACFATIDRDISCGSKTVPEPPLATLIEQGRGLCNLTFQEISSLRHYMGVLYHCLNPALYKGQAQKFNKLVSSINDALKKFPKYEGFVFRGTVLPPNVLKFHKLNSTVTYSAFTSTSTSLEVSAGYKEEHEGQLFLIYSNTGRPVMSMAINEFEKEVLFTSGSKFKILRASKNRFIMREVLPSETPAKAQLQDKKVLDLAKKAIGKKTNPASDSWSCPLDPKLTPDRVPQRQTPDTSIFFQ